MAAEVAEIVVALVRMGSNLLEAGGTSPPKPVLDFTETAGLNEVGSGSVVMSWRAHVEIAMTGEDGVPSRSPGS